MTLLSIEHIVGCEGYFIDDKTLQIWSFKNPSGELDNEPHLLKPQYTKDGYIYYSFWVNGKAKVIRYHVIIVKMFIKPNYDYKKEEIDHKNRNRQDNSIENLCVVSRSDNRRNRSSHKGKIFNYVNDIGNSLIINEEAKIYYSLDLDKFYMYINQTNKFKELHENLHHGNYCVAYCYNNKRYELSTTYFRKNLNKQ